VDRPADGRTQRQAYPECVEEWRDSGMDVPTRTDGSGLPLFLLQFGSLSLLPKGCPFDALLLFLLSFGCFVSKTNKVC